MKAALRAVVEPIRAFLRLEAASGIVLMAAAVAALIWANSSARASYAALFSTPVDIRLGGASLRVTAAALINDGLMTVFFFVVGMEIKRELVVGELRTWRQAMLPGIAAIGGMLVPAAIYLAATWGKAGQSGWGIPMATDIAFAVGGLTLLGKRVPQALTAFLLALAIFDDIGGILVIALFYGHGLKAGWLLAAAALIWELGVLNRSNVRAGVLYLVAGAGLWYALHAGGVHATISGVVVGLMIPARARHPDDDVVPPLQRFLHAVHPWVAFGVMPLFALANAGVPLHAMTVSDLGGPVALGTALGLTLGKPLGIVAATAAAIKLGLADRPGGASWPAIVAVGIVAGIGFTVALFIAALAFEDAPPLLAQAKVGVFVGSLLAGLVGLGLLRASTTSRV